MFLALFKNARELFPLENSYHLKDCRNRKLTMNNGGSYDIRQDPYYYSQNRAEEHQFMNRQNQQYYSQRNDRAHFHRAEPRFQVIKAILSASCELLFYI